MASIIPNKPQRLADDQFELLFNGIEGSDEIELEAGGQVAKISTSLFNNGYLYNPSSTNFEGVAKFQIELELVPAEIESLSFTVRALRPGFRSWSLESQNNPNDNWQDEGVQIDGGRACLVLELTRGTGENSWLVTSKFHFVGEEEQAVENDRLPLRIRSLAATAKARNLGAGSAAVHVAIEVSESMRSNLKDVGQFVNLLDALQGVSASVGMKPMSIVYGGMAQFELDVFDPTDSVHTKAISQIESSELRLEPFEGFLHKYLESLTESTMVYLVVDAISGWIPSDVVEELDKSNSSMRVLVMREPAFPPRLGSDPRLQAIVLKDFKNSDPKQFLDQLG